MNESIYAKPAAPRIIFRPVMATVALHALMLVMLVTNWTSDDRPVTRIKATPKAIQARLVDISEIQPKKVSKPVSRPKAKPKPRPKPKAKPVQRTKPKAKAKPKEKPAPPKVAEKPKPEPRLTAAELAAIARDELSRAMDSEDMEQASLTSNEIVASYAAFIQQTVVNYWSRPPSARNGMEVLLSVQLIPTGEVLSVSVIRGSGNAAFDRSAINAVKKAEQFPELKNLPSREFEKSFRRFRLLFRPEDLRY